MRFVCNKYVAGAMLYVIVEELIPEMFAGGHSHIGVVARAIGFSIMMTLDVALGYEAAKGDGKRK